ncbi:NAD(P)/FAD-dependent oxidoreductase [Andreprevotia chitinilytica]|uniref:NAD(P)-binding protein n=1 Tax=Andreprevotia chitinilytica TaxID=396808 RepID=UPI0005547103|nr:NAD(P)/FAD-dependent oxidoreductase [Andreprevotia chitinilytica]
MSELSRRGFLTLSAASLAACTFRPGVAVNRYAPGMAEGHALRDHPVLPAPSAEISIDTVILGSGVAGLTAGWRLAREGFNDFMLVAGPELGGNATGGQLGGVAYPRGAHYLPLPGPSLGYVREILAEMGVIESGTDQARPYYDERVLVHSPEERLYFDGQWHEGLVPPGANTEEEAQHRRFFAYVDQLKQQRGNDGRRVFEIPSALSSQDPAWLALDLLTFDAWLDRNGYTAPRLRWYLDYACRDDFGTTSARASAWAGLHYFASRIGQAANAADEAVLTWPDGLSPVTRHLAAKVGPKRMLAGMAARVTERNGKVEALVWQPEQQRTVLIHARKAICAMPLHVASHVVKALPQYGFDAGKHMPPHAPWLVANFLFDHFPTEAQGAPLSWDNVVYGSKSLGYVVATHQLIRAARPETTVFSAYHALADSTPEAGRRWLASASDDDLYALATGDLATVYGWKLWHNASRVEITLRGHAMASPTPGFRSNAGLRALQQADGPILFAHSDLSGFSIFEEAAWWGDQAARRILQA